MTDKTQYQHALYRLYDATGVLLYVGITGDVRERFRAHARLRHWWPEIARHKVEWYPDARAAAMAEIAAISLERPRHNRNAGGGGRRGAGPTQVRNIRVGVTWDEGAAAAAEDGETMTAFVDRALRAELRRRARQRGRAE